MPVNFRITTGGTLRTYSANLQKSRRLLNDAMNRVQTHRAFQSYAEDPAAAAKCWQMRRSMERANDQYNNTSAVLGKFSVGYTAMDTIVDYTGSSGTVVDALQKTENALNDPDAGGRKAIGQALLSHADAIITTINSAKYGKDFVFAGADALNCPFEWEVDENGEQTGNLLYRGINVNNPMLVSGDDGDVYLDEDRCEKTLEDYPLLDANGEQIYDENDIPLYDEDAYKIYKEYIDAYNKNGTEDSTPRTLDSFGSESEYNAYLDARTYVDTKKDAVKLLEINEEKTYVDIGMGLQEDPNGTFLEATGYNSSISGLRTLGFGVDEDGDPKNVVLLIRQLGEIFHSLDADSGEMTAEQRTEAQRLFDKLGVAVQYCVDQHVELAGKCEYLTDNQTQLKDTYATLNTELEETERVEDADAITEMVYANYCYQASLKIGNSVLSQSLLDYMD